MNEENRSADRRLQPAQTMRVWHKSPPQKREQIVAVMVRILGQFQTHRWQQGGKMSRLKTHY
jgi:hypothetical protein